LTRKESAGWLAQLDGLRGVSILMVLTAHVHAPFWHTLQGGYGVTVFFVLSGFLITRLLLREERDTGQISMAAFYIRRVFRLFPLYYLVLGVYCVLILLVGLHQDGRAGFLDALPWYLFYLQEIPPFRGHSSAITAVPFFQSWSLGIEEKFYLVWPALAFRAMRKPIPRIALAIGAVLVFSASRFIDLGRLIYPYAVISWGCLFALLYETTDMRARLDGWVSAWRAPLVLLSWPLLHFTVARTGLPAPVRVFADLAYPVAIALVILASLQSSWLSRMFSWSPLVVLGRFSYCIYLIHLLVQQAVERVLHRIGIPVGNGLLVYLLMLLSSVAGAGVLYYSIEKPFREIGRRIANSWTKTHLVVEQKVRAPEEVVVGAGNRVAAGNITLLE